VSRDNQTLPDCTWILCYLFGEVQNCMVWGTPKLPYCWQELPHVARMETYWPKSNSLMEVNHLVTLQTAVPNEALWALLDCSSCTQHLPPSGTPRRALPLWALRLPGLNYSDHSLLEAQPSPDEKIICREYFTELKGNF